MSVTVVAILDHQLDAHRAQAIPRALQPEAVPLTWLLNSIRPLVRYLIGRVTASAC